MACLSRKPSLVAFSSLCLLEIVVEHQAPGVQKLDGTIHRINRYPVDKYYKTLSLTGKSPLYQVFFCFPRVVVSGLQGLKLLCLTLSDVGC